MLRSRSRTLSTSSRQLRGSFNSLVHLGSPFEPRNLPPNSSRSGLQVPTTPQQPSRISRSPSQPDSELLSDVLTPQSSVAPLLDGDKEVSPSSRGARVSRVARLLQITTSDHSTPIFHSGFLLDPEKNGRDAGRGTPDEVPPSPARTPETQPSPPRAQLPQQRHSVPATPPPGRLASQNKGPQTGRERHSVRSVATPPQSSPPGSPGSSVSTLVDGQFSPFLLPGLTEETKILDIDLDQFGVLVGRAPSIVHIADRYRRRLQLLLIQLLKQMLDKDMLAWKKFFLLPSVLLTQRNKTDFKRRLDRLVMGDWDFTLADIPKRQLRQTVPPPVAHGRDDRDIEEEDLDEDPFFSHDRDHSYQARRARVCIEANELRKAMQSLMSTGEAAPSTYQTLERLQGKHPEASVFINSHQMQQEINNFDPDVAAESQEEEERFHPYSVEWETLRSQIKDLPRERQPGVDKLRYEHLQFLVGPTSEPEALDTEFTQCLTGVINLLLRSEAPPEIHTFLRANVLIALPKGPEDVRPIGMGSVIRKLVCKVGLGEIDQAFNSDYLQRQYAMKRKGCETIVHALQTIRTSEPKWDVYTIDADNAFNRASRVKGLHKVMKDGRVVGLFPFLRDMYNAEGDGWYFGLQEGIQSVKSKTGYHQGDILATWMYVLTIQQLLDDLVDYLGTCAILGDAERTAADMTKIFFYVDDGNIIAPHKVMLRIIHFLQVKGPAYGYHIKCNKGGYLLGSCGGDRASVQLRKQRLRDLGLDEGIIKVHPDDVDEQDKEAVTKQYGLKILGSYVGTDEYIKDQLDQHLQQLRETAHRLGEYGDLQGRLLLIRNCFVAKVNYIFRTLSPRVTKKFAWDVDELKKKMLLKLLQYSEGELDNETIQLAFRQATFPIADGGLGFSQSDKVAHAGYVASMLEFLKTLPGGLDSDGLLFEMVRGEPLVRDVLPRNIRDFLSSLIKIARNDDDADGAVVNSQQEPMNEELLRYTLPNLPRRVEFSNRARTAIQACLSLRPDRVKGSVQHQLYTLQLRESLERFQAKLNGRLNNAHLAWFTSLRCKEAGAWLQAVPKFKALQLSNPEFAIALRLRLFLRQPMLTPGTRCTCKHHPVIDQRCHHLLTGCGKDRCRVIAHDDQVATWSSILSYLGMRTKKEEGGLFHDLDPDDNHKPDISIVNPPPGSCSTAPLLLDISITSPLTGVQAGIYSFIPLQAATKAGKAAMERAQCKDNKYRPLCRPNELGQARYSFIPIVYETTGRMHKKLKTFLKAAVKEAARLKKIDDDNIMAYLLKRLSVSLQKSLAKSVLKRCEMLMTANKDKHASDPSFFDPMVRNERLDH
jgi:hypothetical protein